MKTVNITVLLVLCVYSTFAFHPTLNDSLVNETSQASFVEHTVEAQETLYSLLKKYNCKIEDVFEANPNLDGKSTIYVNQVLKFPSRSSSIVSSRNLVDIEEKRLTTVHHIQPQETLYGISKKYNVPIEDLKSINNIEENNIKVGQTLIVKTSLENYEETTYKSVPSRFPDDKKPEKFVVPNAPMGEKISQLGIAEVIKTNRNSTQMLALHRNAPLGSLMTVKNEATGDRVVVKVIGKLPNTGNNSNVLVKLSPTAFYKLNPKDIRFRAEVAYFLPPNI